MNPESASPATREAFAADEVLTRFAPGSPHALRLDCRHEKPGWQARLPGGLIEGDRSLDNARTAGFTVLVLAQLFNCLNARSDRVSALRGAFRNAWLWSALALSTVLQVAVVNVSALNNAFGTVPLGLDQWLVCVAMASGVLWVSELRKLRSLEDENARLKRVVADLTLDKHMLAEALRKKV